MTLKQEKAAHELADIAKAGPKMILKKLNADAKAAGAPRSALDSTLRKGVPEKQQVRDHMKNRNRARPQQSGGGDISKWRPAACLAGFAKYADRACCRLVQLGSQHQASVTDVEYGSR